PGRGGHDQPEPQRQGDEERPLVRNPPQLGLGEPQAVNHARGLSRIIVSMSPSDTPPSERSDSTPRQRNVKSHSGASCGLSSGGYQSIVAQASWESIIRSA